MKDLFLTNEELLEKNYEEKDKALKGAKSFRTGAWILSVLLIILCLWVSPLFSILFLGPVKMLDHRGELSRRAEFYAKDIQMLSRKIVDARNQRR